MCVYNGGVWQPFRVAAPPIEYSGPAPLFPGEKMKDEKPDLPGRVPVVPPARQPGDPIPEIHPSREPEEDPWLGTYIDLANLPEVSSPTDSTPHPDTPLSPGAPSTEQRKKAG